MSHVRLDISDKAVFFPNSFSFLLKAGDNTYFFSKMKLKLQ